MFGINPITSVVQSIIAVFTFKYGLRILKSLFYVFAFTMFLYSAGPSQEEINKKAGWSQVGYKAIHLVRHNLRVLTAKVVPLKASYFNNVSTEEAKEYPPYQDAWIPLNRSQRNYLARGKYTYRELSSIISTTYNSVVAERKKLKREIATEVK